MGGRGGAVGRVSVVPSAYAASLPALVTPALLQETKARWASTGTDRFAALKQEPETTKARRSSNDIPCEREETIH